MTPRWGLERPEGRRLSTKMPPLRGSFRVKRDRPAFQEITHKFVAHPPHLRRLTPPPGGYKLAVIFRLLSGVLLMVLSAQRWPVVRVHASLAEPPNKQTRSQRGHCGSGCRRSDPQAIPC